MSVCCTAVETGVPMDAGMVAEAADALAAEPESLVGGVTPTASVSHVKPQEREAALCATAAALVATVSQTVARLADLP